MDSSSTNGKAIGVQEKDSFLSSFGEVIRTFRVAQGISQEELAHRASLDRTYLSDIERGRRNIGLMNVWAIAQALSVEPADLFPKTLQPRSASQYKVNSQFAINPGFVVTGEFVLNGVLRANSVLASLPLSLYRTVDFKAQSGMVGAVFASELAAEVGAIPNPIEKGHPDIVPTSAENATESELRNYPSGLEVKSTVGTVTTGVKRAPGEARIDKLTSINWQAHHRDVEQLMGITWDYVEGNSNRAAPPVITGVFYAACLNQEDWGQIAGTTGRNTKVTGMKASGRTKMAVGAAVVLDDRRYINAFRTKVGTLPGTLG